MPFVKPVTDGNYAAGVDNPTCNISLFSGVTPQYVELRVKNIVACPTIVQPPPNGTYLLTQSVSPEQWLLTVGAITFQYDLSLGFSQIVIFEAAGNWFTNTNPGSCFDTFVNTIACSPGVNIGSGGTVEVIWGSAIEP